ncbi:TolC family protein [Cognatiluteimonas weifangensis]|uniref:TolC family protein n=1 Tax=Cognatiluteimonas weifangensis TaxID=2303539 RepID=A0A372DNN1_9GAMM|nr:TolC family protein [Luteimonas weifangensis]RFP61201.1 TolC family protein [Luteimonas weifangensis]
MASIAYLRSTRDPFRRPAAIHSHFDPRRPRSIVLGVLLACVWALPPAWAQSPPPGRDVASVHVWLREHNPELRALAAEAEAARARIQPAGALPDPAASIAFRELDPGRPWRVPGADRAVDYALRQRFPLWGKRGLARTATRQQADAAELDRDAVVRDLLAQAEAAYVRYWHADRAVAVLDRRLALLRQVEEIAGVRYALGLAAQQDAIRAQVEQTRMQRERIERLARQREAVAMLNAVLARPADAPLAPPAGPPVLPVRSDGLAGALRDLQRGGHPAVLAQQARAQAARTEVELQRRNRYPDVTLGIGAMQREDGLDSMELMLEVEIPFQQRARRERERESRLREEAALARVEATRNALAGEVASAWTQWSSARERRELTENTLLPQADAAFQSALASYQVGEVDFGTLLEALDQWQGADLDRVDALRDELLGAAAVRAIEGDTP